MSLPVILALALAPFKKRFTLNKKEGGTPMTEEPDEKKKAAEDEEEEARKAAAIARYDEAMAGLDPDKFENESSGEELAPASTIEDEVEAIDEMLEGRDEKFNKLKY
jgi:hypothetical protein